MKISLGMELIFSLSEIDQTAELLLKKIRHRNVIGFRGELGAGKTTLIKAICKVLKVEDNISSPTFSIINEYRYPEGSLFHIDLYRLKNEVEVLNAGVEDCILSGNLCFIEWPDKATVLLPSDVLICELISISDNKRKLQINL